MAHTNVKHLKDRPTEEVVDLGESVKGLIEHPGWAHLMEAIEARAERKLSGVTAPTEDASKYADALGQRKALLSVPEIAQDLIEAGANAAREQSNLAGQASN